MLCTSKRAHRIGLAVQFFLFVASQDDATLRKYAEMSLAWCHSRILASNIQHNEVKSIRSCDLVTEILELMTFSIFPAAFFLFSDLEVEDPG